MNAFLFPGQGSQEVGMAAEMFSADPDFRALVDHASRCAGTDLERICLRGPERELIRTEYLQPLLVAVSLGYHRRVAMCGVQPLVVLGHSLGEVSALAAAGVFDPELAIAMAAKRGQLMSEAAAQCKGGMVAVTTSTRDLALAQLADVLQAGAVVVANDNAPNQFVLSGSVDGLQEAVHRIAQAQAGTCRKLTVAGPWHSPWMEHASKAFAEWLRDMPVTRPRVPVIMNGSAGPETNPNHIRVMLARNLVQPVRWRESMARLRALDIQRMFEIGPGRVLSGLARANGFGVETPICNVNNLRGLAVTALVQAAREEARQLSPEFSPDIAAPRTSGFTQRQAN